MKKADVLVADIGSTITKLCAFGELGTAHPRFLGQGMALTTVPEGDVTLGLERARHDLETRCGVQTSEAKLMAASSAAGGLRMTVHGLTRDMTLRAAREASLGAGAILTFTTAGLLQEQDLDDIRRIQPNIILLAGGVDYGDRKVVMRNAERLASEHLNAPVVYAGNISARAEVRKMFEAAQIPVFVVENVYPRIDELNIEPVRAVIRTLFAHHIVTAPGMETVKAMITGDIMPTPGAVLLAAEALYDARGDLLAIDVGGATSDVHSVTEGSPKFAAMMVAPEPKSKRTVEGDLGVYINAAHILETAGQGLERVGEIQAIPSTPDAQRQSAALTRLAVDRALWRHAGEVRTAYGAYGRSDLVEGRDLTAVKYVIGTGGALTRLGMGREILGTISRDPRRQKLLPPPDTTVVLDAQYVMAAAGVLSQHDREAAQKLLLESLGLK